MNVSLLADVLSDLDVADAKKAERLVLSFLRNRDPLSFWVHECNNGPKILGVMTVWKDQFLNNK